MDRKVGEPAASYSIAAPQDILAQIDQMMEQLARLRAQVAGVMVRQPDSVRSIREAGYFGMWADREDMQGIDRGR